jgi:hypothetical protein
MCCSAHSHTAVTLHVKANALNIMSFILCNVFANGCTDYSSSEYWYVFTSTTLFVCIEVNSSCLFFIKKAQYSESNESSIHKHTLTSLYTTATVVHALHTLLNLTVAPSTAAPSTAAPTVAVTAAVTTAAAASSSDAFWSCIGNGGVASANGQVCCPADTCAECGK